jgi:hypothetical protein
MDFLICQTSAASPAEPGELLFWFRMREVALMPKAIHAQESLRVVPPLRSMDFRACGGSAVLRDPRRDHTD